MNLLLLDDEVGIREGLATILQRKGHCVRTAGTIEAGLEALRAEAFDLVLSDWRLPDGDADPIVEASGCPVVVMSGNPGEVRQATNLRRILGKPVPPRELLAELERFDLESESSQCRSGADADIAFDVDAGDERASPPADTIDGLPADCRDRVRILLEFLGAEAGAEIRDDGSTVTLAVPWPGDDERLLEVLDQLGGDFRVLVPDDQRVLEWRLMRDGSPRPDMRVLDHRDPWPEGVDEFAIDLGREPTPAPDTFIELLDRVVAAGSRGVTVHLLNIPSHLRFFAEVSERAHDVPKREKSGPRLPEVLMDLWS